MLDHLARGRFYWGIGARAISSDLELFGLDPDQGAEVRERSREVLDIVLKIWDSEGKFDYHGKYFDISALGWTRSRSVDFTSSPTKVPIHP